MSLIRYDSPAAYLAAASPFIARDVEDFHSFDLMARR
jgi:hypothetical protein